MSYLTIFLVTISLIAAGSESRHRAKVVYRPLIAPVPKLKIAAVWYRNHQSIVLENLSEWVKKYSSSLKLFV